ncbi:protein fuzzy homolog [Macrosteles quadrilineatus]|uniref:protein fuzzy homolog n=1 Tax=Macrosteles quadrilineatus TaxID=74068 RepID=UPI0023E1AED3|nr:protein fuzzy homolog [Macrosteles quadrilineatus]XP_054263962.1 protein fuzzy homolog [Macrosteles quadrilineatus]
MGIHVIAVTSSSGLPLFSRHRGASESLAFSIVGSLNGVHMFGKSQQITIENAQSQDSSIIWKDFEDSITLIAVGTPAIESTLKELVHAVFQAMVLCVGVEELRTIRSVERLKRELRACFPIVDRLLECLDTGERASARVPLLPLVEVVLHEENTVLQSRLDSFAESVESLFACLLLDGCVAVATLGWWELAVEERKLLSLVVAANTATTSSDIPVFLPCKSPSVPFRLVSVCLVAGAWVSVLCGPAPDLATVEQLAANWWRRSVATLATTLHNQGNLPASLQLNQGIQGLLLIHCDIGKFVLCHNLANKKDTRPPSDILRNFYYNTAIHLHKQDLPQKALETYWCSEYHKVHALRSSSNLLCVLYSSAVPTHTMRLMTQQTLQALISEKQFCW